MGNQNRIKKQKEIVESRNDQLYRKAKKQEETSEREKQIAELWKIQQEQMLVKSVI